MNLIRLSLQNHMGYLLAAAIANYCTVNTCFAANSSVPTRVLFVGNSLTYVNDLPGLVNGLINLQQKKPRMTVDALVTGGGQLIERWNEGVLKRALSSRQFAVVVLQEQGGMLRCLIQQPSAQMCLDSIRAHKAIAAYAKSVDVRPILLGTWGRNDAEQAILSAGLNEMATLVRSEAVDSGAVFSAYAKLDRTAQLTIDEQLHPSLQASSIVAILLAQTITQRCLAPRNSRVKYIPADAQNYFTAGQLRSSQIGGFTTPPDFLTISGAMIIRVSKITEGNIECKR